MKTVFKRLSADGKSKPSKKNEQASRLKLNEQINLYKKLKDSNLTNPHRNLTDLVIGHSLKQI